MSGDLRVVKTGRMDSRPAQACPVNRTMNGYMLRLRFHPIGSAVAISLI